MIVYRVEYAHNGKTYGPYLASLNVPDNEAVRKAVNYFKNNITRIMPEPQEDGIAFLPYSHICGCLKAYDLLEWVNHWSMQELIAAGFTISMYDVPEEHLMIGGIQVTFLPKYATLIKHLTYEQLDEILHEEFMSA